LAVELKIIEIIKRPSFNKETVAEIRDSSDIDIHPEQVKRQKSGMEAKCKPVEINYETKTAIFSGSGKEPYITAIETCTCRDFFVRRLPCKHIYRLRQELSNIK
jgi:predicted nucleic acid-binding Zn finger protein